MVVSAAVVIGGAVVGIMAATGVLGSHGATTPNKAAVRYHRIAAAGLAGDTFSDLDLESLMSMFADWGDGEGWRCMNGDRSEAFFWALMADEGNDILDYIAMEVANCPHRSAADIAEAINDGIPALSPSDLRDLIGEMIDVAE